MAEKNLTKYQDLKVSKGSPTETKYKSASVLRQASGDAAVTPAKYNLASKKVK